MEEEVKGRDLLNAAAETKVAYREAEKKVAREAVKYGSLIAVFLCLVMTILELVVAHRWNFGMVTILLAFAGVADVYEGKKNAEKAMFIKGIVELVFTVFFAILFVGFLFV